MNCAGFTFANRVGLIALLCLLQNVVNAGVVISEFRTRGPNGGGDEFVELYNNSDSPVDISGWKINGSSSIGGTSTRFTINAGTIIPAWGHFLATNSSTSGYSGAVPGNQTYTIGIADDGGIAVLMADNTIVDQVGMSTGSAYKEGTPLTPLTTNIDRSYERKPGGQFGSSTDTNDNAADFQLRSTSDPQNLSSPPTPHVPGVVLVTNTNDSGSGSLRQAIAYATDGDTITFQLSFPATITLTSGELLVDKSVTIAGPGANLVTVNGNGSSRVFDISPGKTSTLSGLTITGGVVPANDSYSDSGGGILNFGGLYINNCIISDNSARQANSNGGGIFSYQGMLTINNSTISNNQAQYNGGGIYKRGGTLTINNSTISENFSFSCTTTCGGGGISYWGYEFDASTIIVNSTISYNYPNAVTGENAHILISNCTVSNNGPFTGIYGDSIAIGNTILANNGPNFSGPVYSNGYNLSNDDGGGNLTATGDQINTDPLLDPNGLQNNGGPTFTHALLAGSPAINSGDPNAPAQDQRYYLRNGAPDKGAFEFGGMLAPISVASRKTHGFAGKFDVNLPLTGNVGVECRSGGATNDYQLVLIFPAPVSVSGSPQAQVTSGAGQVGNGGTSNGGAVSIDQSGTVVTVPLTNVSNGQRIAVTVFNVSDGTNSNDVVAPVGILIGDTNADTFVDAVDVAQTKSKSGQAVNGTNFREDVNADGFLDAVDVAFVKSKSGTTITAPAPSSGSQPARHSRGAATGERY